MERITAKFITNLINDEFVSLDACALQGVVDAFEEALSTRVDRSKENCFLAMETIIDVVNEAHDEDVITSCLARRIKTVLVRKSLINDD